MPPRGIKTTQSKNISRNKNPEAAPTVLPLTFRNLDDALRQHHGVVSLAAKTLGVSPYRVKRRVDADPRLQKHTINRNITLADAAKSVVEWNVSPRNPDENRKLRTAMYLLEKLEKDYAPTIQHSGAVDIPQLAQPPKIDIVFTTDPSVKTEAL